MGVCVQRYGSLAHDLNSPEVGPCKGVERKGREGLSAHFESGIKCHGKVAVGTGLSGSVYLTTLSGGMLRGYR